MEKSFKKFFAVVLSISIFISSVIGGMAGFLAGSFSGGQFDFSDFNRGLNANGQEKIIKVEEESAVVAAVEKVSPAVVSIIITKNLPQMPQSDIQGPFGSDFFRYFFGNNFGEIPGAFPSQDSQIETQPVQVGGGTGFIITPDGYIVTNRHVVSDEEADYTILTRDGSSYDAEILSFDVVTDLAVLKIEGKDFPTVEIGDSSGLKVGQTAIAIGNALGEFSNTVSVGVISGLSRSVVAFGQGIDSTQLTNVIQTDASINPGNSGGPLLNLAGQVIGINTAIVQGAQNIGFAIPINEVVNVIESVQKYGRIIRPWLGVRYITINKQFAQANNLAVDYGALIIRGGAENLAVIPGSPAAKAGLVENDIILDVDGKKITEENPLVKAINNFKPGEKVRLRVLHNDEEKEIEIKLEEMK